MKVNRELWLVCVGIWGFESVEGRIGGMKENFGRVFSLYFKGVVWCFLYVYSENFIKSERFKGRVFN